MAGPAACTALPGTDPGTDRAASPRDPGPTPPATSTPQEDPDRSGRTDRPRDCDAATTVAVSTPVAAQLDALARGDFTTAYAQASPFFRTMVPPEGFSAIIRDGYPELLDVETRRLEACTVLNRRAVLVVTVRTSTGAGRTLAYELSETAEGWRIDGAGDVAAPDPGGMSPQA